MRNAATRKLFGGYFMNYLLQAYACSPYKGGEYAVSWGGLDI